MATIVATLNAASPGTQADDVTTDVNLTYKVYNDVDSYVTPETFGSHVTDANVTVSAGVVTITNVTDVGITSYKISSVDEAGNESILSDASGASIILFEDDFTGTTIDTGKWLVTNPNSTHVVIEQDGLLKLTHKGFDGVGTFFEDYARTQSSYDSTSTIAMVFDFSCPLSAQDKPGTYGVGLYANDPATQLYERIMINRKSNSTTELLCVIKDETDATAVSQAVTIDIATAPKTIKMVSDGVNVTWSVWNGSAWTQLHTVAYSVNASALYASALISVLAADPTGIDADDYVGVDNLYIANADFLTQYPV